MTTFNPGFRKKDNPKEYMRLYMAWRRTNKPETYEAELEWNKTYSAAKRRQAGIQPRGSKHSNTPEYHRAYAAAHRTENNLKTKLRYQSDPEFRARRSAIMKAYNLKKKADK